MTNPTATKKAPTSRDVLGVPVLPPGFVTAAANRLRSRLGRIHAGMAPPPLQILEGLFGMLDHRVLVALCELGVPDVLDDAMTPVELAHAVGADAVRLERMIRFASTRGWLRLDRRGRVRPTAVTRFLRADHPGGWRAWVEFAGGEEILAAVAGMTADPVVTDGFAQANGHPYFAWMADHPQRWATFDRAMAAGGRMHALALAAAADWSGTERICDVGGGTGDLLSALLDLVPEINGAVFDLPDVIGRSCSHDRMSTIGGDMFESVPAGFDTYLLVNVLHDWSDEDASRILDRVAGVAGTGSRVIVVDNEHQPVPRDRLPICADLLMAALTNGGRERSSAELADLGRRSGLRLERTTRLATADLAHLFRPNP